MKTLTVINMIIGDKDSELFGFVLALITFVLSIFKEVCDAIDNFCCSVRKGDEEDARKKFQHSWKAFFMHFVVIAAALVVSVVYLSLSQTFWYEEAVGVSSTVINVYGAAKAFNPHTNKLTVWDADDVVTPAHATDQFFVMTKLIKTVTQNKTICTDEPSPLKPKCTSDDDCEFLKLVDYSDGYANGTCDMTEGTCYVHAWCPVDIEPTPNHEVEEVLDGTGNFIVHINTSVIFKFPNKGLKNPNFNPYDVCLNNGDKKNGKCPFIRVDHIVKEALKNQTNSQYTFKNISNDGGVFSIVIDWNCTYEKDDKSPDCDHSYSFRFLQGQRGYSYTDVDYQNKNSRHFRKEVGMLFFIEVNAKGKAFSTERMLFKTVVAFVFIKSIGTLQSVLVSLITYFCYRSSCCCSRL